MSRAPLPRTAFGAAPSVAFLVSLLLVSCNPGGGPSGGSEEASAQTATLLVGGPGGGSSRRDVQPSVPGTVDLPTIGIGPCRPWDELLRQGEFTAVVQETQSEIDAGDPARRAQALLYNSLGRLYTGTDPSEVLESLDQVPQKQEQAGRCGAKATALRAEGRMFALAALGEFQAAEQELAAVAALVPAAEDDLRGQLEDLQTGDETTTTAPAPSPTPTPAPTPVTPSPSESL
jgi:hypothetical protein